MVAAAAAAAAAVFAAAVAVVSAAVAPAVVAAASAAWSVSSKRSGSFHAADHRHGSLFVTLILVQTFLCSDSDTSLFRNQMCLILNHVLLLLFTQRSQIRGLPSP